MTVAGGCLCGAVRWQSAEPPITTRVCWCRDCQYLGAGSGTVGACFRTATFEVTGTTSDYSSVADSGNRMHRRFCSRHSAVQRGRGAASSDLRSGRHVRRSGAREACDDHLDGERADVGLHGRGRAADGTATAARCVAAAPWVAS